jgi:hypothetical protein
MNIKQNLKTLLVLLVILIALTIRPSPSEEVTPEPVFFPMEGEKIKVNLRVLGTGYDKEFYKETSERGCAGTTIALDETSNLYAGVGAFDEGGNFDPDNLCMNSIGSAINKDKKELIIIAPHFWWVEVQSFPSELGKLSLEIKWEHYFSEKKGYPVKIAGDTRMITLKEREKHVLDFLDVNPMVKFSCYRNVIVEITAQVEEDPELVNELIEYDIWLQHKSSEKNFINRRYQALGRQGEIIDFHFLPMRFPVPDKTLPETSDLEVILEVAGKIQGRVRRDGSINVRLDVSRWIDTENAGSPRGGGIGDGGTKLFSVSPDESVSMVLPSPSGSSGISKSSKMVSSSSLEKKLDSWGDVIGIDHSEFFKGQEDSLILTIRRVH